MPSRTPTPAPEDRAFDYDVFISYSLSGQPRRAVPLFERHNAIQEKRDDKRNLAIGLGNVASMAQLHIGALRDAAANLRRRIELGREIGDEFWEAMGHLELGLLLSAAHRVNRDLNAADRHLTEALTRCRNINLVEFEADILLDLARLRVDQAAGTANPDDLRAEALRLAEEALIITERSGYVLQGADVNLFLAAQAKAAGDLERARQHAATALDLATCDGPPDYTYRVAYEKAKPLVAELAG